MATKSETTKTTRSGEDAANGRNRDMAAVAGVAIGGVALGVMAMIARKAVVQAPTALAGDWDVALAAEHAATLKLFDALQATDERNTTKRSILLTQMKHALAKHALQEENVIYPALREAGHAESADELNTEHGYVKQYLYELENMPNDSPGFLATVAKFRADIEDHMREEEDELFPRLKSALDDDKNKHLTLAMNKEGFKLA